MTVAEALAHLMRAHEAAGSPLPRYLRPGAAAGVVERRLAGLGLRPPAGLVELYGLHDGVDETAWMRDGVSDWYPELLPGGVRFVDSATAVRVCRVSRKVAGYVGTRPWWEAEPAELWPRAWFPVFPIEPADSVVIGCDEEEEEFGALWIVRPEIGELRRVAGTIAGFVEAVAEHFAATRCRWDPDQRLLVEHEQLARRLGAFP